MDTQRCSFDEEKIIGAAYGDSGLVDRLRVFLHLKRCGECNSLYREYKRTAVTFTSLKRQECPSTVTDRVENRIGIKKNNNANLFDRMLDFIFYRPAYVLSGTSFLVVITVFLTVQLSHMYTPGPEQFYTNSEIRTAQEEIEKTFAMIVPVVHYAQVDIRDKIIMLQIVPPVRQSVEKSNQLFIEGFQQQ